MKNIRICTEFFRNQEKNSKFFWKNPGWWSVENQIYWNKKSVNNTVLSKFPDEFFWFWSNPLILIIALKTPSAWFDYILYLSWFTILFVQNLKNKFHAMCQSRANVSDTLRLKKINLTLTKLSLDGLLN
jgi:hypothetical protein